MFQNQGSAIIIHASLFGVREHFAKVIR